MSTKRPRSSWAPGLLVLVLGVSLLAGCGEPPEQESDYIVLNFETDEGGGLLYLQVFHPYGNPYRESGGEEKGGIWIGQHPGPHQGGVISQPCYPSDLDFWMRVVVRHDPDSGALFNATWHHVDCYHYLIHVHPDGQVELSRTLGPTRGRPIPP